IGFHGLEHRECSLNGVKADELRNADWDDKRVVYLLPHEFAHAWCGKYRRPAGMYKDNFMDTKRTDLLWVYEGMTQYLGYLLAVRCGYADSLKFVDDLAGDITGLILMKGREWRPLRDTEVSAYTLRGGSDHWAYLRRSQDYYREGAVFFFEINAMLRNLTDGQKSLDDFCRSFFAPREPDAPARPFTREEVVTELAALAPYNWDSLIEARVYQTQERFAPTVAEALGYRLEYTTEAPARYGKWEKRYHGTYFLESLGLSLSSAGQITSLVPGSPADNAGLAQNNTVIGVEGKKYSAKRLEDAVRNTATSGAVNLLVLNGETYKEVVIPYDGGLRYYTLIRRDDAPDRLMEILRPLTE
ncbi:MAG TPA: hypothetical protein VLB27_01035, partial [candidate division Zixibacteria bacterium]|nr:hypothetical protein [candidate division Zixibacteria bacterium]